MGKPTMSSHARRRQKDPEGGVAACFTYEGAEPTPQRNAQQSAAPAADDSKRQELEQYIYQARSQLDQLLQEGRQQEAAQVQEEVNHLEDMLKCMPSAQPPAD